MVQFTESYDVLVAGGGVAGVAASVAAARAGMKTALVEKTILPGGLATSGLINWYTPLCDGSGNQVTHGLAEELLHLSIRYGPGDVPPRWRSESGEGEGGRYGVTFSPAAFVLALDELLVEAGVELWFDTLICLPVMEGNRVVGLEVENKSGRGVLRARCVVDATGDADVAFRAGAPCEEADNWLTLWTFQMSPELAETVTATATGAPLLKCLLIGADNAGRGHPEGLRKFSGTDARDVTQFVIEGRARLRQHFNERQAGGGTSNRHNVFPLTVPSMAQFRTTRRIAGHATLSDGMAGRHFDDSVGLVADWNTRGQVWEIPYGTLLPQKISGLLAAGRCISSEGLAWEVTRVIHGSAHTGELAGTAASIAVRNDTTPDALDVGTIQEELRQRGIVFAHAP